MQNSKKHTPRYLTAEDIARLLTIIQSHGIDAVARKLALQRSGYTDADNVRLAACLIRRCRKLDESHSQPTIDVIRRLIASYTTDLDAELSEASGVYPMPAPMHVQNEGAKPFHTPGGTQQTTRLTEGGTDWAPSPESKTIEFNGACVRMILDERGEPWFVAKDLVEAVGATWRGADGISHIPAEYRGVRSVRTLSGDHEVIVLAEAGMNMYLFRSDKPAALPWQRHLAEVVLPTIRKTGQYVTRGVVPYQPQDELQLLAVAVQQLMQVRSAANAAATKADHALSIAKETSHKVTELAADNARIERQLSVVSAEPDDFNWLPIDAYAKANGVKLAHGESSVLGRMATRVSRELGLEVRDVRVPSSIYTTIHSYHVAVLARVFTMRAERKAGL